MPLQYGTMVAGSLVAGRLAAGGTYICQSPGARGCAGPEAAFPSPGSTVSVGDGRTASPGAAHTKLALSSEGAGVSDAPLSESVDFE